MLKLFPVNGLVILSDSCFLNCSQGHIQGICDVTPLRVILLVATGIIGQAWFKIFLLDVWTCYFKVLIMFT